MTHNKLATISVVKPQGRYGMIDLNKNGHVKKFAEKPDGDGSWINGGYFVLSPKVINRIKDKTISWEAEPLGGLAKDGELASYEHDGFWQPMDTLNEKKYLNDLYASNNAPWVCWE